MTGLSLSDVTNVTVQMSPTAASERNFSSLLILGDSNVIDIAERLRLYASGDEVASDFGSSAPEYAAASLFFAQSPTPAQCYVGRWASSATSGMLRGAVLTSAQQAMSNFTSITNGGLSILIDGTRYTPTGMNFSGQTNLNGVAAIVQAALSNLVTVRWDALNFRMVLQSASTGTKSSVSYATSPTAATPSVAQNPAVEAASVTTLVVIGGGNATDISGLLGLTAASGARIIAGSDGETLLAAVRLLADMSTDWYGLQVASSVLPVNSDYLAVASYIEAASVSRIFGITTQDPATLDSGTSSDLASVLQAGEFKRTFDQYSSNEFASASIFGRAFTVDFDGTNTTITLKFKQEPNVSPETLTETQSATLTSKHCNVFVRYNNNTAILQQGVMANGYFLDEVYALDWLQNDLQTNVYDELYLTGKVPQTDAGINRLVSIISGRLEQAVVNGLLAPGVWNGPPIGAINTGDTLSKGYYVYAAPIASQSQADREARKAPLIQAALKLAGAVHDADVVVTVNR